MPQSSPPALPPLFVRSVVRFAGVALSLALGLALLVATGPAPAFAQAAKATGAPDTWYTQTFTEGAGTFRMSHMWSWGRRFRSETVVSGHPIVTIVTGTTYYTFDPVAGNGVGIERSEEALRIDARGGRPFADDLGALIATGGEKIGPDPEGRECDLYRRTNSAGRVEICVTRDADALPLYVQIYDRATTHRERVRYLDWQRGFTVAESFFEPPAHIRFDRMDYATYRKRSAVESIGPAPPLFSDLLHGIPE